MRKVQLRKEEPSYPITSVNHALRLIQLLRDTGPMRVSDAASELGVSVSTAHRLLAMLVFRDFVIQDEDRIYHPGPGIGQPPLLQGWVRQLRSIARPHMETLVAETGETANLMLRVGGHVRFLLSVVAPGKDRVGDREGTVLPAAQTAGGRAMLAALPERVWPQFVGDQRRLWRELEQVRSTGYARNLDDTEIGVSAIGAAVREADGRVIAGIALAARSSRAERLQGASATQALLRCRDRVELELGKTNLVPERR